MDTRFLSPDSPGLIGGQFQIQRKLGAGGMGEVYLAEQIGVGRKVVLKLVHAHLLAGDEVVRERFGREARALAQLNHPNIVQLYTFGTATDGRPYFAMEFVDGRSLADELGRTGPMSERRALTVAADVAGALAHAHQAGVIHRDIKPDNVMLSQRHGRTDFVTVLDFGIAKMAVEGGPKLTQTHASFGTPQYVAPEQATGRPVTAATDIYALGTMLFEMLTGRVLFTGDSPFEVVAQHVSSPPSAPSSVMAGISPEADAIVLRCLEKDPAARFASAAELEAALRATAAGIRTSPSPVAGSGAIDRVPSPTIAAGVSGGTRVLGPDVAEIRPIMHGHDSGAPATRAPSTHRAARSAYFAVAAVVLSVVGIRANSGAHVFWQMLGRLTSSSQPPATAPSAPPTVTSHESTGAEPIHQPPTAPATPPALVVPGASAQTDALEDDAIAACLNRHADRGWASYYRYLSWVNPARGPTGHERNIYGLYTLYDVDDCTSAAQALNAATPMGTAMVPFAKAVSDLARQAATADAYYRADDWKDDAMAKGKAIHPSLMASFGTFTGAYAKLIALVEKRAAARDQAAAAGSSDDVARRVARLRLEARKLARASNIPWRELVGADGTLFESQISRVTQTVADLQTSGSGNDRDNDNVRSLIDKAKAFVSTTHLMKRRMGAHPGWSTGERMNLDDHGAQWMVNGAPEQVIRAYNDLVTEMNGSKLAPGVEALQIHCEDPRRR